MHRLHPGYRLTEEDKGKCCMQTEGLGNEVMSLQYHSDK